MAHEGNLHIRVPEGAKDRWLAAATAAGVSLSTWVIAALDATLARAEYLKAVAEETVTERPVVGFGAPAAPVDPQVKSAVPAPQRMTFDGALVERPELADDDDIVAVIDGTAAFPTGAEFDAGFPMGGDDRPAVVGTAAPKVVRTPEERARIQRAFRGG